LHLSEAVAFLREDGRRWPLIIAADMLCYLGALDELFGAVRTGLTVGGRFVFSTELISDDGADPNQPASDWVLGPVGRYAHTEDYVIREAAAAGLVVRSLAHEPLRSELDRPVPGLVVVLERADDD
jgi:predicted TPR repeat methyltransferase